MRADSDPALRGMVFDLDGTLADTLPVCVEAFQKTFLAHGGPQLTPREVTGLFGPSEEGILERILGASWVSAFDTYLTEYRRAHASLTLPFPGVVDVLDTLTACGARMAVVTGKGIHSARISLEVLDLERYFETVEAGSPRGQVKTDALLRILRDWGMTPKQIAYVGDSPSDVDQARVARVVSVGAGWGDIEMRSRLAGKDPDLIFETVGEFASWARAAVCPR